MAAHSSKQAEPLLTRTRVVTVIGGLSAALVWLHGGVYSTWLDENKDEVAGGLLLVLPYISARLSRKHVTPVASPKDADGVDLAPATTGAPFGLAVPSPLDVALIAPAVKPDAT